MDEGDVILVEWRVKTMPAPSFLSFLLLPAELRRMIWSFVTNQPRNVDLQFEFISNTVYNQHVMSTVAQNQDNGQPYRYFTTQPTPAMLHTNAEARAIGLQHYQPYFGRNIPRQRYPDNSEYYDSHGKWSSRAPPRIWINKQVDRLFPVISELDRYLAEVSIIKKEILRYGLSWRYHGRFDAYYRTGPQPTHAPENSIALEVLDFYLGFGRLTEFADLLWRGEFFSEILVYSLYKKDRQKIVANRKDNGKRHSAKIEFRDVDPNDPATKQLRENVDEIRKVVHQYLTAQQEQRQRYFVNAARLRGEVYEKKDCGLWKLPTFKAVMIVLDGVVQENVRWRPSSPR